MTTCMLRSALIAAIAVVVGCKNYQRTDDMSLRSIGGADRAADSTSGEATSPGNEPELKGAPGGEDYEQAGALRLRYGKGVKPVVADYLFVLDNSYSMNDNAARTVGGLEAIPSGAFPESAQLGVMTTMVASDPLATSLAVHPDVENTTKAPEYPDQYRCIEKEPGFLSLVSAAGLRSFKACNGVQAAMVNAYSKELCESGWFKPFDVNSKGQRCFAAALQSPFYPVGCEAGLLAVEQMLARHKDKPLFRDNAAVNVIFVSDEQVGCVAPATRGDKSKAAEYVARIKAAIQENSNVASISLNGVVPNAAEPKVVPADVLSYQSVIAAAKGLRFDVASMQNNYNSIVAQFVQATADITTSEFYLPSSATKIISIEVAGVKTTNYQFDQAASKVKINGLDPNRPAEIIIRYQ